MVKEDFRMRVYSKDRVDDWLSQRQLSLGDNEEYLTIDGKCSISAKMVESILTHFRGITFSGKTLVTTYCSERLDLEEKTILNFPKNSHVSFEDEVKFEPTIGSFPSEIKFSPTHLMEITVGSIVQNTTILAEGGLTLNFGDIFDEIEEPMIEGCRITSSKLEVVSNHPPVIKSTTFLGNPLFTNTVVFRKWTGSLHLAIFEDCSISSKIRAVSSVNLDKSSNLEIDWFASSIRFESKGENYVTNRTSPARLQKFHCSSPTGWADCQIPVEVFKWMLNNNPTQIKDLLDDDKSLSGRIHEMDLNKKEKRVIIDLDFA